MSRAIVSRWTIELFFGADWAVIACSTPRAVPGARATTVSVVFAGGADGLAVPRRATDHAVGTSLLYRRVG